MLVCEQWLRNDFLVRQGYPPHDPCECPDCPPLQEPATWRDLRRGDPPNPTYLEAKRELQERGSDE